MTPMTQGLFCRSSDRRTSMERLLLYLDDIDDLIGVVGLLHERLRRLLIKALSLLASVSIVALSVVLALESPALALAISLLLFLALVYRTANSSSREGLPLV